MLRQMQRGVLGGTFDPIHIAHLVAAEAAFRQLGLEVVTFVPAGDPWQKSDRAVTPAQHRLAMVEVAVADIPYFTADGREVRRPGPSYTIDTLESFPTDEKLTLILGADAAAGVGTWHRSQDVLQGARLAIMTRAGTKAGAVADATAGADVVWLDVPPLAVSGTEIRSRAATGRSVRFLVPEGVFDYLTRNGLYAT